MLTRLVSILCVSLAITFASAVQTASACRCWVGNAQTTDEERKEVAQDALDQTHFAVIGRIIYTGSRDFDPDLKFLGYSHRDAAVIKVEAVLHGDAPSEIVITENSSDGVYDGTLQSNLLGTCGMRWQDQERNVWLLLKDKAGNLVLASSCAHDLVRKWLYPEFWNESE